MTHYRELSDWHKKKVDEEIVKEIEPKHHVNKHNGFEWDEPQHTLDMVHSGDYCAKCWNSYYTCVCSHGN